MAKRVDHPPLVDGDSTLPAPVITLFNKWAHIGDCTLTSRGFSAQLLVPIGGETPLSVDGECGEIPLAMKWGFQNAWEFVRHIDAELVWYFRGFSFTNSARMLGTVASSMRTVHELPH